MELKARTSTMQIRRGNVRSKDECIVPITAQYIKETLSHYQDKHIYLQKAWLNNGAVFGQFKIKHYPFTKPEYLNYLTAPLLFLILSQIGYIFTRVELNTSEDPRENIEADKLFFAARDSGNILISKISRTDFVQKINLDDDIIVQMNAVRIAKSRSLIVANMKFSVSNSKCKGEFQTILKY
jgi:hypothetical protein